MYKTANLDGEIQTLTPYFGVTVIGDDVILEVVAGNQTIWRQRVYNQGYIINTAFANTLRDWGDQAHDQGVREGFSQGYEARKKEDQIVDLDDFTHPITGPSAVASTEDLYHMPTTPSPEVWDDCSPEPPQSAELQLGDYGAVMREDENGNRSVIYDPEAYLKIPAHR